MPLCSPLHMQRARERGRCPSPDNDVVIESVRATMCYMGYISQVFVVAECLRLCENDARVCARTRREVCPCSSCWHSGLQQRLERYIERPWSSQ